MTLPILPDEDKRNDGRDWARRILLGRALGTYTLPIGIENAREALGLVVERQAGEDDA